MSTYAELTDAGVTTRAAAVLTGVARATATRTLTRRAGTDPAPRLVVPANRLTDRERTRVLGVLDSTEFVDQPPLQVYATLLERGEYLCSVSTMYRILAEAGQVAERRRLARHPARTVPELVATGPGQVYSWDITKLPGPTKGVYYDAYVMIDIYSRYIVGAHVHTHETGVLAEELMTEIFGVHGIPAVVHADRGTSMTSKTVAALLADLGVTRSHSRPSVSNDNPYSESLFKTMKYTPEFPDRFGSIADARIFMRVFADAYKTTSTTTPGSACTPPRMSTTATPAPSTRDDQQHSPPPAQHTPNGSPPTTTRRSSPSPATPGSTNQPNQPPPNTHWPQTP